MIFFEHSIQALSAIFGIFCWKKVEPFYLKWVVVILILTCINESIIIQLIINGHFKVSQDLAYNIFSIFDMIIWATIFYKIYLSEQVKMFLFIPLFFSISYSLIDIFCLTGLNKLHLNSIMVYDMSIILLAGNFLYYSLKKEYYKPLSDPFFWICAACIGYHSLLFINFITLWLPKEYWKQPLANTVWDIVILSADIFYYLLLSIAFITCTNYKFRRILFQ